MKRFLTFAVAFAVLCGSPMITQARDDDRHDDRHDDRGPPGHEDHHGQYYAPRYEPPPGYERHAWQRGEMLPPHYHVDRYVVVDYGHYGLREPPRGYHWVRVDNDFILVAITTGIITDVLLNALYN
jgi:Ni/Co efflux regulator RcnB